MSSAPDDNTGGGIDYKAQLDEAAKKAHEGATPENGVSSLVEKGVEKVSQYVPAVSKLLGHDNAAATKTATESREVEGPPDRPDHDSQIEEFVRDQHRSRHQDVVPK